MFETLYQFYDQGLSLPAGRRFSCSFLRSGSRIITAAVPKRIRRV